ncbi:unnamed protein product [Effrenium voratum]|nr:unnamed protein product [Effrenium voratum]
MNNVLCAEQAIRCGLLVVALHLAASQDPWPICENREFRDDETEPGGLKLLGVKESPLGYFPPFPAALTHEHFFQQLRDVLSDDCPRIFVEIGLQPAAGRLRNWSATALWLRYFNHSGLVLAVDPVADFLEHFANTLKQEPWASIAGNRVKVKELQARVASTEEAKVKQLCADGNGLVDSLSHPCYQIRRRDSWQNLDYTAPLLTFDAIWKEHLGGRHIDFLHLNLGGNSIVRMFHQGFSRVILSRALTALSLRIDKSWTKKDLQTIVEYLDKFEYFSMFRMVCRESSQVGTFAYYGPGGVNVGPTTYLPLSSMDIDTIVDWEKMPFPQDVIALDLRQPDIFKTVQIGDAQCDAEDEADSCDANDDHCKAEQVARPPERPQLTRVVKTGSRSITLEWRPHPDGPTPDGYLLRVEPGAFEETVDHDTFDALSSVQSHTINGLRPDVEYTISLCSLGVGGESGKVILSHRTESEDVSLRDSPFDLAEDMHCGMGAAEEVQPPGPSPAGASYFPGVGDVEGCKLRCEGNRQCVAFQVHAGDACWLYRQKPPRRLAGPKSDLGWWCAIRRQ